MKKMTKLAAALLCATLLTTIVSCANAAGSSSSPSANEGEQVPVKYKVSISSSIANGRVTASADSAAAGTEISLSATANQGYVWSSYTVTASGGAAISVSAQGKFTMPASDVTVSASFVVGQTASLSNLASVIASLTQDSTIAMTGQVTSDDIETIKDALVASGYKIKLDLRGVTGLTSLPRSALDVCRKLQSLYLPEGLTEIGRNAFMCCENLESIYLPSSFDSFEQNAFDIACPSPVFTSIYVAEGNANYLSIDGVLFSKDKKTLAICPVGKSGVYTVPAGVTTIGVSAFHNCEKLTSIVLPDTLQEICKYAFAYTEITSMTIPASVITIYENIFNGNTSLTSLTFSDTTGWHTTTDTDQFRIRSGGTAVSVDDMNAENFRNGNSKYYYKDVPVSDNVSAFVQRVEALTQNSTVSLSGQIKPTDLGTIYNAINEAAYKVKLDMSRATGLTSLPDDIFNNCAHLQEIILPEGLVSIGNNVFISCNDLESITIPASVTSIFMSERGLQTFNTSNLLSVNVAEGNAVYSSVDGVLFSKDKKTLIFYPLGKTGSYNVPNGVKVIGQFAFYWCRNLSGITLPNTVNKIEKYALALTGVTRLEIPDSVTVMGESALLNCDNLTSLKLSSNLTKIESYALSGINITSIEIPGSVTSIAESAFQSCFQLESIVIPNSVTSIGGSCFYGCSKLKSIEISASVTNIGTYVFQNCSQLKTIVIPSSVTSLGNYLIGGCSSLTSITFEDPNGWYHVPYEQSWKNKSGGQLVDLSNESQNVTYFKSDDYRTHYWYKKNTQN